MAESKMLFTYFCFFVMFCAFLLLICPSSLVFSALLCFVLFFFFLRISFQVAKLILYVFLFDAFMSIQEAENFEDLDPIF